MQKEFSNFFQPSGSNNHPLNKDLPFSEYIEETRALIRNARLDLNEDNAELIVDANSPFELRPNKKCKNGVLLIHGLYCSPSWLKDIGESLYSNDCLVRAVLLPGHGTVPGDLLNITYEKWLETTLYGIKSFKNEVDNLFIVGYSTGALLALHHVLNGHHADGLILFAPALKIRNPLARFAHLHRLISWAYEPAKWLTRNAQRDYAKYESQTLSSGHEVFQLGQAVRHLLNSKELKIPSLTILSDDDYVINSNYVINSFLNSESPYNKMRLYTGEPNQELDKRITTVNNAYPEEKIINFSHYCLSISPNNFHYGSDGDYKDFQHYKKIHMDPQHEHNGDDVRLGGLNKENLKKYFMQRLTYNPDFENMMGNILQFIG